ncbi:hypothetical protein [Actinomadura kijaniata]|uniref:hypothetical protein n=1 Tax=Actinomadura kijaniata TaxID=46161 RepID=UPI000835C6C6|nr:hypothetical protein [Actinomadura kijaniata]
MSRAEHAAAELPRVRRLADQYGPALNRAYTTLLDGALNGPAADRLFTGMAARHRTTRTAFYEAFDQVRRLAAQAPHPPRVREPHVPGPPSGPRGGDIRSGSPNLLNTLAAELSQAGAAWQNAGGSLARVLTGLGLDPTPGTRIRQAGQWLSGQRQDLEHRRTELLKEEQLHTALATARIALSQHDAPPWQGYWRSYLPGVWDSLKDIGLAGLAGNPWTAPYYLMIDPDGWRERGPIGQLKGLYEGVQDPVALAKAAIDWEEWKRDPLRAYGRLGPNIVLTVLTGGAGATSRLGTGVRTLSGKTRPEGKPPGTELAKAGKDLPPTPLKTAKPTPPPDPGDVRVAGPDKTPPDRKVAGSGGSAEQQPKVGFGHHSDEQLRKLATASGGLRGVYEQHGAGLLGTVIGAEAKQLTSGRRAHIVERVNGLGLPRREAAEAAMHAAQRAWGQAGQIALPNGDIAVVPGHPTVPDTFVVSGNGTVTMRRSTRWYDEEAKEVRIEFLD